MMIYIKCIDCNKEFRISVIEADLISWKAGQPIQDAMPYLREGERELIISKICERCYDKAFGDA
jgi:hypothetical protein